MCCFSRAFSIGLAVLAVAPPVAGEDGRAAWLRYAPLGRSEDRPIPAIILALNASKSSPVYTAGIELQNGIESITGRRPVLTHAPSYQPALVVGTVQAYEQAYQKPLPATNLAADGFWLQQDGTQGIVLGANERGALYGAFEYLSRLAQGNSSQVNVTSNPTGSIRWVNQWDNLDGSIERGYGGASVFFADGGVVSDLTRATEYARLLASIRVNTVVVNNVNANASLLLPQNIKGLARIADCFRPYGVQLGISLNFASPQLIGGLDTFDPLEPSVIQFWANVTDQLYRAVPDMAGYLVKANSEGQPGPLTYNRTLAEGANLFARAVKSYGGIVMFRAFVYNMLNESDWRADRANAAVDFFKDLDGAFDDNVVVQIKSGPIDFQVREPASPLFANIPQTNTAIELQVAQEYLGQQCHLVYLPPLWKTVLDFDMRVDHEPSLVRDIVSSKRFGNKLGGSVAVVNVGMNTTWLGSHLAMSNLYAYGRLAWDAAQDPESILQDWIRLTFGPDPQVIKSLAEMSMLSWPAYEGYTGNLGIQTLTDILFNHYAANPASQENNGYGQWTRADHLTVGMDRTVSNGTGFAGQYPAEVFAMYENVESTPDSLLLWFHHVNWTHRLDSGKTVIQHFYDAHYEGSAIAQSFPKSWGLLQNKVDPERFHDVMFRLMYQAGHAIVWRDAISNWFYNVTGIPDHSKRVGHHPWRVEAEHMTLDGYKIYSVAPFEDASNATAIITATNQTSGTATATLQYPDGIYDVAVNYFDMAGGRSHWELFLNNQHIGHWTGDAEDRLGHAPSPYVDSTTNIRITFPGIKIREGDVLKIKGTPDGTEPAPLDYVAILPDGVID